MFYLMELRDSDGNDCTVYDVLIEASDKDSAVEKAWNAILADYPDDETDGGYGTFHPCDCACEHRKKSICNRCIDSWECSHGGLLLDDENIEEYATHADALAAHRHYHSLADLLS